MTLQNIPRHDAKHIARGILTSDAWLYRALTRLFEEQTNDEQTERSAKYDNGAGFNAADARVLTPIAQHLKDKGWISARDRDLARVRLVKYAGQLARIANHNELMKLKNG